MTSKQTRWSLSALAVAAMLALPACKGGGGGGGTISQAWYDVYGYYCGSSAAPGCNFYANGDKIMYLESPYYAPLEYGTYYYYDSYGFYSVYTGWARLTSDGILYDEWGYALNSNEERGRDVITNAAAAQKAAVQGAANALAAKYELSSETAMNVATALNDWALIGKSRKRTEADVAAFTKRLTGLNVGEVSAAMEAAAKGDSSAVDQAIGKAARTWSTSPDTMKQILKDWMQQNGGN